MKIELNEGVAIYQVERSTVQGLYEQLQGAGIMQTPHKPRVAQKRPVLSPVSICRRLGLPFRLRFWKTPLPAPLLVHQQMAFIDAEQTLIDSLMTAYRLTVVLIGDSLNAQYDDSLPASTTNLPPSSVALALSAEGVLVDLLRELRKASHTRILAQLQAKPDEPHESGLWALLYNRCLCNQAIYQLRNMIIPTSPVEEEPAQLPAALFIEQSGRNFITMVTNRSSQPFQTAASQ